MKRLRFKPVFHVEIVPPEGVFLFSERARYVLKGEANCRIARHLDGSLTAQQIVERLNGSLSPLEVLFRLDQLEEKGYVELVDERDPEGDHPFWQALGVDARDALARLATCTVAVHAVGRVVAEPIEAALAHVGLRTAADGDLAVVVTDDYLQRRLRDFNEWALSSERPWLVVKPVGTIIWIGPLFRAGETGCWECLAQRLRGNRRVETYVEGRVQKNEPVAPFLPAPANTVALAADLTALSIAKWFVGAAPSVEGVLTTFDVATMDLHRHALVRRPQCASCGWIDRDPARAPDPPTLRNRPKGSGRTQHSVPARETLERFSQHVSPYLGAVTELTRLSTTDEDVMHVYGSGLNLGAPPRDFERLRSSLRTPGVGKGETAAEARASALCEALERYSGVFHGDEIRQRSSFRRLGVSAIHPNACMLFSEQQFRQRETWNARTSGFQWVPSPFVEDAEHDWTPVWSLTREAFAWLPTGYLYYDYGLDADAPYRADSNGNAAGNCLEEAILHGFLELVERDSVALWWYNRVRRPAVDVESFADPWLTALIGSHGSLGRTVWALDLVADLGIPAVAAISARLGGTKEDIVLGFGAHLDAKIALKRAMAELNQMLCVAEAREAEEEDLTDPDLQVWLETATVANQSHLLPDEAAASRRREDYPELASDDLLTDISTCRRIVEDRGMEMLVLDQTRPDIGLPVAKVIVPGLRHFWARFAPGRLYDVPVQIGWRDEPLREDELNPIPFFL